MMVTSALLKSSRLNFFFWKAGERVFNIAGDCGINRTGVAPKIRKKFCDKAGSSCGKSAKRIRGSQPPDLFLQRHSLAMGKRKSKGQLEFVGWMRL